MPELLINPISILLATLTIVFTLLYLNEYNKRKQLQKQAERTLEKFRDKGLNLLHTSMVKSQDILGEAELEGIKVVASSEQATKKMEEQYSGKLSEIINESKSAISAGEAQFIEFMKELQTKAQEFETANEGQMEKNINEMFDRLETRLSQFLIDTEQKTTSSIELEIKAARELIEGYKQQQLSVINENIIAMMEQTLSIVLAKKLTLKDQIDLVYEALERAKVEKFIL